MVKLSAEQIESLLNDIGELPTLPSIATAIMEKTLEANVNARQIAELVEKDQALALKVLKVANSPSTGESRRLPPYGAPWSCWDSTSSRASCSASA